MSRTNLRALLLLGAAAFLLRAGCAVLTEYRPIFPAYYFTDANLMDDVALITIGARENPIKGKEYFYPGSLSQRLQVLALIKLYKLVGPRPLAAKLVNAVLGASAVVLLALALMPAFGAAPALITGALVAVWPSAVFFTSHNLKEAPLAFFAYASLAAMLSLLTRNNPRMSARSTAASIGIVVLIIVGLFRPPVLIALSSSLGAGFLIEGLRSRRLAPGVIAGLLCCLLAPVAYSSLAKSLAKLTLDPRDKGSGVSETQTGLIPAIHDGRSGGDSHRPLSPRGLTDFRSVRAAHDRRWAELNKGREIGTQLFPDQVFDGWGDVALFLPKSAFYILYMPLPGLYPMEGKPGRIAAAAENLLLLALTIAALAGALRGDRTPARAALVLFFLIMTAGSALLELDLGSSARHKLLYLPMLFPFAAELALKRLGFQEPA